MKNFTRFLLAALFAGLGVVPRVFASEQPPELVKDRARIAQALKEKNPQRAAKLVEPWIKKRPHDVELANDYALALAQMGKLDQAREVLEEAFRTNPETGVAFQNLREILSQQAAISYAKAMGKRPPTSQVALKSTATPEAPTVVAQVEPRPGASTAPPPPKAPPQQIAQATPVVPAAPSKAAPQAAAPAPAAPAAKAPVSAATKSTEAARPQAPASTGKPDESAIIAATQQWAEAWSSKNFKRYIDAYSAKFQPQNFPSRDAWVENRRPRVTKPGRLVVRVSDIRVKLLPSGDAEVTFRQRYESGDLKLNSTKTTVWTKESGTWKILREEGR
jgi:tetratricopeptide (TPR) repeat protein